MIDPFDTSYNMKIEIEQISRELQNRISRHGHFALRIFIWNFTIAMSYMVKRFFDIAISLSGIIILSPVFIVLAIAVRCTSAGPIIFRQTRVGQYGRHFCFYKFRSMYDGADMRKRELLQQNQSQDGVIFKMKKDPRITPAGTLLRKSSLDELPQLFNVLVGDMSLVGPRPPVPNEVKMYTLEERKRLNVLPGITCIWQISGRSDIPFKRQVALDKEYIVSRSIWKDLWILLKTIPAVLSGKGAY